MKTITFAGSKGGSGKTTLCYNVAVEAARKNGVLLTDLDPQQSLADLWRRRGETVNPRIVENVKTATDAVRRLTEHGFARDFFFVDTPGSNMAVIRDAILAADAIILPVQPSPMDLLAQEAVIGLVQQMEKGAVTMFALNRVDARSVIGRESRAWLARHHRFPIFEVRQRTTYARGAIVGKAAGEIDHEAQQEISALWGAIEELMK